MTRHKPHHNFWIYLAILVFVVGIMVCLFGLSVTKTIGAGAPPLPPTQPAPTLTITAYCPCEICCGKWSKVYPRRTASGHIIEPNDVFVAAPPNIPFGTLFSIPGYAGGRMVAVLDRGGKIKGNRLDVFFGGEDGHNEALAWGVQEFEVKNAP